VDTQAAFPGICRKIQRTKLGMGIRSESDEVTWLTWGRDMRQRQGTSAGRSDLLKERNPPSPPSASCIPCAQWALLQTSCTRIRCTPPPRLCSALHSRRCPTNYFRNYFVSRYLVTYRPTYRYLTYYAFTDLWFPVPFFKWFFFRKKNKTILNMKKKQCLKISKLDFYLFCF